MSAKPTADVSVRVAWADDAPGIAAVQVRAWRAAYADLLPADALAALDAEQMAAGLAASLREAPDARNRVLVALERNRVVRVRDHRSGRRPRLRPRRRRRARASSPSTPTSAQGPRLPAAPGRRRHPGRRPVHPRGDLGASRRRRAARLPHERRLGPRRRAPRARPRRRRLVAVKQVRLHTAPGLRPADHRYLVTQHSPAGYAGGRRNHQVLVNRGAPADSADRDGAPGSGHGVVLRAAGAVQVPRGVERRGAGPA